MSVTKLADARLATIDSGRWIHECFEGKAQRTWFGVDETDSYSFNSAMDKKIIVVIRAFLTILNNS